MENILYFLFLWFIMSLNKTQQRILYSLGHCYKRFNQQYKDKPLSVFVSKMDFIKLIKQAEFINKKERALYKNLEHLEKKKLIEYLEKKIRLTQKGKEFFNKIEKEIKPLIEIKEFWNQNIKAERQLQTYIDK